MQRLRPHPIGTYESPVRLSKPAGAGLPVTYVAYTTRLSPRSSRAGSGRGRNPMDLPRTGVPHDVEVPHPETVVELLAGIG